MVDSAETLLINGEGAPIKRLGFLEPAGCLVQLRQIVEAGSDLWIVRAKTPLVNFQGAPIK